MSRSKEVRIPEKWAKIHNEVLKETPDERLFGFRDLVNWTRESGVTDDEGLLRKYCDSIHPIPTIRAMYPVFPNNLFCRTYCKLFTDYLVGIYLVDDQLEADYSFEEVEKICNAYDKLDKKLLDAFPVLPSMKEMKDSLQYLEHEKLIAPVAFNMDWVNQAASLLLHHGSFSEDDVLDYRRRLSNATSLYLQAVQYEKLLRDEEGSIKIEVLWRRIFGGAAPQFLLFLEISAGALGKTKMLTSPIAELYVLSALYSVVINDLYSYHKEKDEDHSKGESIVKEMLKKREIENLSEAPANVASILNEITKYTYKKIEGVKAEYPNHPEIHQLMNNIGYTTVGWYYFHEFANDRYKGCTMRLPVKEVVDSEIQQWLAEKDSYGWDVVKSYLTSSNAKAKIINDALSDVIPAHGVIN